MFCFFTLVLHHHQVAMRYYMTIVDIPIHSRYLRCDVKRLLSENIVYTLDSSHLTMDIKRTFKHMPVFSKCMFSVA